MHSCRANCIHFFLSGFRNDTLYPIRELIERRGPHVMSQPTQEQTKNTILNELMIVLDDDLLKSLGGSEDHIPFFCEKIKMNRQIRIHLPFVTTFRLPNIAGAVVTRQPY